MSCRLRLLTCLASALMGVSCPAWAIRDVDARPIEAIEDDGGFLRTIQSDDGMRARLEAAIRAYVPIDGDGPTIFLASAVHIGDAEFYHELQTFLDAQDVVLFESVGYEDDGERVSGDALRAAISRRRARWLSHVIRELGGDIDGVDDLLARVDPDERVFVESALRDAWGRPFALGAVDANGRTIGYVASLGADGKVGGDGVDADIITSPAYPPAPEEVSAFGEGIQQQLADALGLVFQLGAMRHDRPNWHNSDMSAQELVDRMGGGLVVGDDGGSGSTGDPLFDLLQGRGFLGKAASFMVRMVGANPRMRALTKAMLVDIVAQADEIIKAQGGELGRLMDILVHERNRVVIEDLREYIANPDVRTIGVIYGAGHLPGIEEALLGEMKYQRAGARWLRAIEVDLSEAGLSPVEVRMLRSMMRRSLERQLRR